MTTNFIASFFVNACKGLGFWTGFTLRNQLIRALQPHTSSRISEIIVGLCVIVSALLPITAGYHLVRSLPQIKESESAAAFALSAWFLIIILLCFVRRVLIWPSQVQDPNERAELFNAASLAVMTAPGAHRWKLIGICVAQVSATSAALYYISTHPVAGGIAATFAAVSLPAITAAYMAGTAVKAIYRNHSHLSPGDQTLMGITLSANLATVGVIVVGMVIYGAVMAIAAAVFVVGGFIIWRAFVARTEKAGDRPGERAKSQRTAAARGDRA